MTKPHPSPITLLCAAEFVPGAGWIAEVQFRPTRYGFSMWNIAHEFDELTRCVEKCREPLSWRTACQLLLEQDNNTLGGDFRFQVQVTGAGGWQAEMLAICWMRDDEIPSEVKNYLVRLPVDDLQWLADSLDEPLTHYLSISLLSRYLRVERWSPRRRWAATMSDHAPKKFRLLVERLWCPFCGLIEHCVHLLLAVDETFHDVVGGALMDIFDERWAALRDESKSLDAGTSFEKLLKEVVSLSDTRIMYDQEAVQSETLPTFVHYYASSEAKAKEALKSFGSGPRLKGGSPARVRPVPLTRSEQRKLARRVKHQDAPSEERNRAQLLLGEILRRRLGIKEG